MPCGRLGSGHRLVGRMGSGVRVSASCQNTTHLVDQLGSGLGLVGWTESELWVNVSFHIFKLDCTLVRRISAARSSVRSSGLVIRDTLGFLGTASAFLAHHLFKFKIKFRPVE